ncbi:hypothetical protein DSM104443_00826 [Usitatibacter rugosus]|uniref:Uncharacterized protein n=1 Tax=Usitatibacter rugosus TaxID=2732067 RepID=A0A6M4GRS4_9PROT|nr:hypothetical protein [Usitatibacter rugosus]QJR09776.1 hypothetical protein DSM104443_00826 [Usitatibacter rugosus]
MNENIRIQRLIREARVQRSADVGIALGEFLADLWIGTAEMFGKLPASRNPGTLTRVQKTSPAR